MLPGQSTGALPRSHLPSVVPISTRQHAIALSNRIQLTGTSGTQFGETGIRANTFDFAHPQNFQTAQLGRGLYLAAAVLQSYDGDRWAEADFSCAPDTATGGIAAPVQSVNAGTNLTVGETYLWRFIYEEIDGQGEIHPGATSAPLKVLMTAANNVVTITIPTYRLTNKRRVRIGVFRSKANATGTIDQIEFFRVSSVDPTVGGSNGYLLNDTTVDTVTFVDQMPDATAALLEPLYTNGGTLSNDPVAMGGGAIAGGKSRLFWTDPSNPNLVRYSQQLRDDTAMETGSNLSLQVDPYGGPIVAIGVMDDAVYAFKTTSVYGFAGPGPDADGGKTSTNAFSPAQLVTSDVGCTDPNSVCQSPMGIVFKSAKGFKLLGRDQQVQDIGAPVYGYNGQTVTRATLLPIKWCSSRARAERCSGTTSSISGPRTPITRASTRSFRVASTTTSAPTAACSRRLRACSSTTRRTSRWSLRLHGSGRSTTSKAGNASCGRRSLGPTSANTPSVSDSVSTTRTGIRRQWIWMWTPITTPICTGRARTALEPMAGQVARRRSTSARCISIAGAKRYHLG